MKQRKGFTLIELLAVIVILAIVALISTPLVLDVINNAKKGSFNSTSYGIIKAAEMEYTNQMLNGQTSELVFTYVDGKEQSNKGDTSLKYSGKKPQNGTVVINNEGKTSLTIHNGTFCSEKTFEETIVKTTKKSKEDCIMKSNNLFAKIFGGSNWNYFYGIAPAHDGYVVVGESRSSDYDLEGLNNGYYDAIIVKYDLNGNVVWKKNYGGNDWDKFYGVASVNDGYVVVGESQSSDYDLEGLNKGDYDAIIVKYDLNGNVVWKKNYGGSNDDSFNSITSVNDGYVVVGVSQSSDYDLEGLNKGDYDAIIVKYDLNGNVVWKKNYGGSNWDGFYGVASVNDGYAAVGSSFSNDYDLEGLKKGYDDAIIVKYDLNGNVVWKKNYGGSYDDSFNSITSVNDGYVVVGESQSSDYDLEGLEKGNNDAIIVKYDLNGNFVWKKNYGGSNWDNFYGVASVNDGYTTVGYSSSNDYDLENLNGIDYLGATIVKFSLNGQYFKHSPEEFDPNQRIYKIEEIPFSYETATTFLGDGDDYSYEIELDFDLNYGGKTYNKIYATTNGHLAFTDITGNWYNNKLLSNISIPFIAVYWDDLSFFKENSGIYYKLGVENGVKYLLVEYRDVTFYDGNEDEIANFEVKIYKNGDILMSYQNVDFGYPEFNNGSTAVVGIKTYSNRTYQYLAYERLLSPNKSILFK